MVGFELCSALIRLRASSKISSSRPTGVHGLGSGLTSKSGSRRLPIGGSLPLGTTGRGNCGSSNPSGTFPDCARLKNRRMVQGSSVTPRCPSSAAIAGHVALSFRNRRISLRYGQSWLWNGFGCDVGFMVKATCPTRTRRRDGYAWLLAARKKRRKDPVPKGRFAMSNFADPFGTARWKFRMEHAYTPSWLPPDASRRPPFKGGLGQVTGGWVGSVVG